MSLFVSNGSHDGPARHGPQEPAVGLSFTVVYDLWLVSWERALAALATATRSRTLSTTEAAAHKAVIAAERELVVRQFTLLLGRSPAAPDGREAARRPNP